MSETGHDPPAGGDEPRRRTLPDDRNRPLGYDDDPKRVREGAVERRARDRRNGRNLFPNAIEVETKQVRTDICAERLPNLKRDGGGSAADLDPVDGEDRRVAGDEVAPDRRGGDAESNQERAS